ncbi:MAG: hypothetical protein ABR499_08455 [Gemmatimonadaceae bacterium]
MSIVTRFSTILRRSLNAAAAVGAVATIGVLAGACGGGRAASDTAVASGDAGGIEVDALNYEVTPERYQRWSAAQRALDAISGLGEPPALDPTRFSEADVNRAVQYLESDPRARAALARAGVSARDYVLTTLALDQALVATASGRSNPTASAGTSASPGRSSGSSRSAGSGGRAGERAAGTAPSPSAAPRRTRTRYRNVPPTNAELVERNREDIARVRGGMRFRIVKERVDTVGVDEPTAVAAAAGVVPGGTTIPLRADTRVCTNTHKAGDRVTGTVTAPVSGANGASIPAGASASLSVVGAARSGNQRAAPMEFSLNSITIDGRTYPVAGTAVASRVDRVRVGSASKDAQKIAGGAAIGAVAGQVLGKDTKSTVIGAAVGAAAGAAAAGASARYDSCVPLGAPITVTLRDALHLRV